MYLGMFRHMQCIWVACSDQPFFKAYQCNLRCLPAAKRQRVSLPHLASCTLSHANPSHLLALFTPLAHCAPTSLQMMNQAVKAWEGKGAGGSKVLAPLALHGPLALGGGKPMRRRPLTVTSMSTNRRMGNNRSKGKGGGREHPGRPHSPRHTWRVRVGSCALQNTVYS